jgi:hypothetical protein
VVGCGGGTARPFSSPDFGGVARIHHPYLIANTFLICFPISFVFIDYRPEAAATLLKIMGHHVPVNNRHKHIVPCDHATPAQNQDDLPLQRHRLYAGEEGSGGAGAIGELSSISEASSGCDHRLG